MEIEPSNYENIVIHVGDAVRWDYASNRLSRLGPTYKTISASLHTPTSFATMVTGQEPTTHGVYDFRHSVETGPSGLLEADSVQFGTGFMNDWLSDTNIFPEVTQTSLSEAEPPFVWINRGPGGHAPYDGFTDAGEMLDEDAKEYWKNVEYSDQVMWRDYNEAINKYIDRVESIRATLEEMGILEETLIIATSDHGEILGEYGQIGHNLPASPELVYVPTTFIHKGGPSPERNDKKLMRHVDLAPTALSALAREYTAEKSELPGRDLLTEPHPTIGVNYYKRSFSDFIRSGMRMLFGVDGDLLFNRLPDLRLEIGSVWDGSGGHVFNSASRVSKLLIMLLRLAATPEGRYIIHQRSFRESIASLFPKHRQYQDPSFEEEQAERILEEFLQGSAEFRRSQLDESTKEQMEELGYI